MSPSTAFKTIVITGGGTGGHIFPALAVAEALQHHDSSLQLHYIGNLNSMEAERAPNAGLPFTGIAFHGMPRRGWTWPLAMLAWFGAWAKATQAVQQQFKALQPSAVFATGGYVTAPVILAALLNRIPVFLHEPDAMPGLVNRLFGRWATGITVAFEAATMHFPKQRVMVTGNPVRATLANLPTATNAYSHWFTATINETPRPVALVMGGSLGAKSINDAVLQALPTLISDMGLAVLHQVGDKPWRAFEKALADQQIQWPQDIQALAAQYYRPMPFINTMPEALAAATVAVCRAGSMTLSELGVAWLPALLIPYPHAAANHQWHNAQACANQGKAIVLADNQLTAATLCEQLAYLLKPQRLTAMRHALLATPYPTNAASVIAQQILSVH